MTTAELETKTVSELTSFRTCPRMHSIAYVLGIVPLVDAPPLWYGTLIHKGLEEWWLAWGEGNGEDALPRALDALSEAEAQDAKKEGFDAAIYAKARVMLRAYDARWSGDMDRFEVVAVEAKFSAPLINPETGRASRTYQLGGKLDVLVFDRKRERFTVVEHKTSSEDLEPGSAYWAKLRMDPQISTYFHGGDAILYETELGGEAGDTIDDLLDDYGGKIKACLYDVLGKPAKEPKLATPEENRRYRKGKDKAEKALAAADPTHPSLLDARQRLEDETLGDYEARLTEHVAENPERYLGRAEVVRLGDELEEFDFDVWQSVKTLHEGLRLGRFPRNPAACFKWGRPCAYWDVCTGSAQLDDELKFRRKTATNEELA